ncbi:MAG: hypothetical protein A2776_02870 [Candidatus Levybacteria bacterium RIFCSPHIGHO2_01_FULL_40_10]|nr:MAG: hypothetical protein A2776_02870 [Candidatus Levybacteria bacterium RIFCSPHIGHO2_01_FULL_40_10]
MSIECPTPRRSEKPARRSRLTAAASLSLPSRPVRVETENFPLGDIAVFGLTATGKSGLVDRLVKGRKAVKVLHTDTMTVERTGMSIDEIVAKYGWDYFRREEAKSVLQAIKEQGPKIISLGGGALMNPASAEALKKSGITRVHVTASFETIDDRIMSDDGPERPELEKWRSRSERIEVLKKRWELRGDTFRESADVAIDTEGKDIEAVAAETMRKIRELKASRPAAPIRPPARRSRRI